jgi:hypothetical protein
MSFKDSFSNGIAPYRDQIREVVQFLISYLKNPVVAMRQLPQWDWLVLCFLYTLLTACFGLFGGIVQAKVAQIFVGLFFYPVTALVGSFLVSGFFYYTFIFFYKNEVPYKLIHTTIIFASLPLLVLNTFSSLIPPIGLVGSAVAGVLMLVAFAEYTHIPKEKLIKLLGAIFIIQILFYVFNMIDLNSDKKRLKDIATPESIETIKKEFSD